MLVLSRKPGEVIRVGDQIRITVVKTGGNQVRLAIEAPEHLRILRGELAERQEPLTSRPPTGPSPRAQRSPSSNDCNSASDALMASPI
jgi:carbon storage regulator